MASTKQIGANRENALKSTGPRTGEGKARAAQNARTHGLTAARMVVDGEEAERVEAFRDALQLELAPVGAFEMALVDEIVFCTIRLQRLPWIEASVLAGARDLLRRTALLSDNQLCDLGEAFQSSDAQGLLTTRLPRYEAKLARRRDRVLEGLWRLQWPNVGQPPCRLYGPALRQTSPLVNRRSRGMTGRGRRSTSTPARHRSSPLRGPAPPRRRPCHTIRVRMIRRTRRPPRSARLRPTHSLRPATRPLIKGRRPTWRLEGRRPVRQAPQGREADPENAAARKYQTNPLAQSASGRLRVARHRTVFDN